VNEDFRAGGPYLCSVPVLSVPWPGNHQHQALNESDLFESVHTILNRWSVELQSYHLCGRQSKRDPEQTPIPTILILAKKLQLDFKWLEACREIHSLLVSNAMAEVSVEIADERAFRRILCFPVRSNDGIFPLWDSVCSAILNELNLEDMKCIECFRLGTDRDPLNNPPTVMVTVAKSSTRDWKQVREQIVSILNRFKLPSVAIAIAKGTIQRGIDVVDRRLPRNAYQHESQVGLSLGVHKSNHSASTFGGWVELCNAKTGNWHNFGITCYHCVLPDQKKLSRADQQSRFPY
jgi:hypothetical protein